MAKRTYGEVTIDEQISTYSQLLNHVVKRGNNKDNELITQLRLKLKKLTGGVYELE